MNIAKNEPLRIDYPKHWFVILILAFEGVAVWLFYTTYSNAVGGWRTLWMIVSPTVGIIFLLFLLPPVLTYHLAGEKGLRIRMGWLINTTIPYGWITEMKETSVRRGGLSVGVGVRYFPISKALYVTSSFTNLVALRLDGEHVIGRIRKRRVEEIVLSVSYMPAMMENVKERASLTKGA
jgi:hypothetical protein